MRRGLWCLLPVLSLLSGHPSGPASAQISDAGVADGEAYHPAKSAYADAGPRELAMDAPSGAKVLRIPIEGLIDLGLAAFVRRALSTHTDASLVVLDVNTLGGRVDAAIQIRDALLESPVRTVAFVHPRAISAGALISLACDVVAMAPGGSLGAVTPLSSDGDTGPEAVEEKMTSYMRTEMRATAEAKGRRGDVAEAMVDRDVHIDGVVRAGKLLTLDTAGALALRMADLEVENLPALLEAFGLRAPRVVDETEAWAEQVARFLTDPTVAGLLMSIGMLGLMIELYSPGWGLPGIVGLGCLIAFFFGHAVANLAGLEELLLIGAGLVLLLLEILVVPGFGITGILGLMCLFAGLVLSMVGGPIRVSWQTGTIVDAIERVSWSMLLTLALAIVALRFLPRTRTGKRLVLASTTSVESGYVSAKSDVSLLGQCGEALTALRPAGNARIGGRRIDVVTTGEYVDKGQPVRVVEVSAARVVVEPVEAEARAEARAQSEAEEADTDKRS